MQDRLQPVLPHALAHPQLLYMDGLGIAIRLLISGLPGFVIAVLYRISRTVHVRSEEERNPGLFATLVLLAMLITLVTIAVGSNVAVAVTLVGTLAIVRFRTTVSDVRDTAFVIFSVAVGTAGDRAARTARDRGRRRGLRSRTPAVTGCG